jgi:diacylglycerol O-acyltransferase / wax synthase
VAFVPAERLTPLDASFLYLEEPHLPMHVGGLAVFDPTDRPGGPISFDRLREMCEERIPLIRRWRQRVVFPPFDAARPGWVDDPHFELGFHLRRAALPKPGGAEQLAELTGEIQSMPLDRDRPLWEMYLIDGLEDGYQAVLTKTHHAMLDGVAGMDLCSLLFDAEPVRRPPEASPPPWDPDPLPTTRRLLFEGLADRIREPIDALHRAAGSLRSPRSVLGAAARTVQGTAGVLGRGLAPKSSLNAPVGSTRRFAMTEISLEDAKAVGHALGGTVNDVFLTAVAGGIARVLDSRGEPTGERRVRTMMPISVRTAAEHEGSLGNRVTTVFVDLPIGEMGPERRFAQVHWSSAQVKCSLQGEATSTLLGAAMWVPPWVHRWVARFANAHLRVMNLVASNIPGPQMPLWLDGSRLVVYYPLMPIGAITPVSIAVVTLVGVMGIGITADRATFPEVRLLAAGIDESFEALAKAAGI